MGSNENGVIEKRTICKACKKSLTGKSSHGIGHLLRHRKKCEAKHSGGVEPWQTTLHFFSDGSFSTWSYDQQRAKELHVKYVASTQQPLRLTDDPVFEEYVQNVYNPQYRRVFRNSTRADCIKVFCEMRQSLINEISTCTALVS